MNSVFCLKNNPSWLPRKAPILNLRTYIPRIPLIWDNLRQVLPGVPAHMLTPISWMFLMGQVVNSVGKLWRLCMEEDGELVNTLYLRHWSRCCGLCLMVTKLCGTCLFIFFILNNFYNNFEHAPCRVLTNAQNTNIIRIPTREILKLSSFSHCVFFLPLLSPERCTTSLSLR